MADKTEHEARLERALRWALRIIMEERDISFGPHWIRTDKWMHCCDLCDIDSVTCRPPRSEADNG